MHQAHPSARQLAWETLSRILGERQTLDEALPPLRDDLRPAVRMLLLSTLRHLGQIDALLNPLLEKKLPAKHRPVMDALRLGAAQLLIMETAPHAVVHEMVALVKGSKHAPLAGMVNAVLKKLCGPLPDCRHNLPGWLEQRWKAQYGKAVTDTICAVASQRPPLDVNTQASFEHGTRLDETIWRMAADHPQVPSLPGFEQGTFFVQDVAASYPVRLLKNLSGKTVLDIGAAPGGKTLQLAQAGAQVTALDKSESRSKRIHENLQRMRLSATVVVADALEYSPPARFDVVVLDAPCSATGTWRRHPEVVHVTTPEDITELAATQRALLARAWSWVKPGGQLLYCVCSLEAEEGEQQQAWFLQTHGDALLQETLRTTPAQLAGQGGMDGFFAMTIKKK